MPEKRVKKIFMPDLVFTSSRRDEAKKYPVTTSTKYKSILNVQRSLKLLDSLLEAMTRYFRLARSFAVAMNDAFQKSHSRVFNE